jgi:hypothetical protein
VLQSRCGRVGTGMAAETAPEDGTAAPRLNTEVPHSARIWNYWLGGEDNISQVVSRCPRSGRTLSVQARHANFSNVDSIAVRVLSCTSMDIMSDFLNGRS